MLVNYVIQTLKNIVPDDVKIIVTGALEKQSWQERIASGTLQTPVILLNLETEHDYHGIANSAMAWGTQSQNLEVIYIESRSNMPRGTLNVSGAYTLTGGELLNGALLSVADVGVVQVDTVGPGPSLTYSLVTGAPWVGVKAFTCGVQAEMERRMIEIRALFKSPLCYNNNEFQLVRGNHASSGSNINVELAGQSTYYSSRMFLEFTRHWAEIVGG